jgi:hypothetical protein
MNRVVKGIVIACGALAMSTGAFAQEYGRPGRSYFQDRDRDRGYWDRERMMREYRGAFYDRLQRDLARAEHARYLSGDDWERFRRAHREVGEFQAKWNRGIFDPREMDEAIASVQRVVDIRGLHRDDRDALRDDLARMRSFRVHMERR